MCHQWRLKDYRMQTPCRRDPVLADIFEEELAIYQTQRPGRRPVSSALHVIL